MDKTNAYSRSIYLIAPSGIPQNKLSCQNGINWLKKNGHEVLNTECLNRSFERFAGTDEQRLNEINSINQIANSKSIVMSVRGGYGINRLLPMVDWNNLALSTQAGIQLIGHSDFTALNIGLFAKTQAVSLSGPMLAYDFGIDDLNNIQISQFTWGYFQKAISSNSVQLATKTEQPFLTDKFEITTSDNAKLWGGNLSMLVSLIGGPYFPSLGLIKGGILFIEDINEHPYRIERMLWQLLESGILSTQAAIIFGDFSAYKLSDFDNGYNLKQAIERINKELISRRVKTKILVGLPLGHIRDKVTLPVGARASLIANPQGFTIESSW